ncbi:MAG: hypothetical protein LBH22_02550 [Bacteroidales bacterium]|jgi:hypothetical protein|nr:hypothetical protein [Bacteroidales bacterium]
MPFIKEIQKFRSVSIVGMAKNTGKTTCLNYVIRRLQEESKKIALTSIGVDGEERDILYDTPKPRIVLHEGMVFVTSEQDFEQCEFPTEILSVSDRSTALGRLITAQAKGSGKVVLSGPSDSAWLQTTLMELPNYGVELTLVDGALSRMSLASPAVTDAMILCTGAACSPQLPELIRRTRFRCSLIDLEQADDVLQKQLQTLENGIWVENPTNREWGKIGNSVFTFDNDNAPVRALRATPQRIYITGAITDHFFKSLNAQKKHNTHLIITDFTKLFITPLTYDNFLRNGGQINVLQKAKLLAVCTNPTSPEGAHLNPIALREQMQEALGVNVYDVVNEELKMEN